MHFLAFSAYRVCFAKSQTQQMTFPHFLKSFTTYTDTLMNRMQSLAFEKNRRVFHEETDALQILARLVQ